eukprot:TRINITY_DN1566_c0_g1_i1.p1 TRINITY_DN1566_c0_g1~~TRINITY_DN1566_c0_g1_i1.p1  ORF type:complete len:453 (-),score=87.90 TRINITY_DN1566_c0_g1_i1:240-1598(-)
MSGSGEEEKQKQTHDFSREVEVKVPEFIAPAQKDPKQLRSTLDNLLSLEKKARLAGDAKSTTQVAVAILKICYECKDWIAMNEQIKGLCEKRAQLLKVTTALIQEAVKYVDLTPNTETQVELIKTLRTASEGRIFVELERARLTKKLAEINEKAGKTNEASDILNEVQVETIGTMEVREKNDFLLEQLRLVLFKKDYIRSEIIAKKINPKNLNKPDLQDLKLKYYELMIQFYTQKAAYLNICRAYLEMYNTPVVANDSLKWKMMLKKTVMFAVLSPFDSEVSDIVHRLKEEKKLTQLPNVKSLVDQFVANELMSWPLRNAEEWSKDSFFMDDKLGKDRWDDFHKRIVEHNIRVVSGYYARITMSRLTALLLLDEKTSEKILSEMVSSQQLYAKYDRRSGVVSFTKPQDPNDRVQSWSNDISSLLALVETTCQAINKENMVHHVKKEEEEESM